MRHFGQKVKYKGYTFDSKREMHFFRQFIENSGQICRVHESFTVFDGGRSRGQKVRKITYAPDFVIYSPDDTHMLHVYDVKTSLSNRGINAAAILRFKLFQARYDMPVEIVVPRKNDFLMTIKGYTTNHFLDAHPAKDKHGKLKKTQAGHQQYKYYNVYQDINYDIDDIVGV